MDALEELSVAVGGFAAFGLAPLIGFLAFVIAPRHRLAVVTIAVTVLTWLLWLAQFVVWLFAFDEPIPGETVPNALLSVSDTLMHATTAGCLVLLVLLVTAVGLRVRRDGRGGDLPGWSAAP